MKMAALHRLRALFKGIILLAFGSSTCESPPQLKPHPPPPLDLECPRTREGSRAEDAQRSPPASPLTGSPISQATTADNNSSNSSSRSLTELLAPATFCSGIFYSIPPNIQADYHGYILYEPLLAIILLGMFSSVVAVYYVLRKSHGEAPAAVMKGEAEAAGANYKDDSSSKADQVKDKLLEIGLICSAIAFLLRVLLQLTKASLWRVAAMVFTGGVAGTLHFWLSSPPPR